MMQLYLLKNSLGSGHLRDEYKPNNLSIDRHGTYPDFMETEYEDPDADDETVSSSTSHYCKCVKY